MNEIQYGQTVAAQEECEHWLEQQDRWFVDAEESRNAMQDDRVEKDRQRLLRMINFYDVFS